VLAGVVGGVAKMLDGVVKHKIEELVVAFKRTSDLTATSHLYLHAFVNELGQIKDALLFARTGALCQINRYESWT
jgi:hypothetical protein